jgi:hypothetical protein
MTIVSYNNTLHIAIFNYENHFCYHITEVQKLHSSPKLNSILKNKYSNLNNIPDINVSLVEYLLYPNIIYSKITNENESIDKTYKLINEYYKDLDNNVTNCAKSGYAPNVLLTTILLPAIAQIVDGRDNFITIIGELSYNISYLDIVDNAVENNITTDDGFLRDKKFKSILLDNFKKMKDWKISLSDFKSPPQNAVACSVLEVFPIPNQTTNGHAINLFYTIDNKFLIVDSISIVDNVKKYINERIQGINRIIIRHVSSEYVDKINKIVFKNEHPQFTPTVASFVLNVGNAVLIGGGNKQTIVKTNLNGMKTNSKINWKNIIWCGLFMILILIIIKILIKPPQCLCRNTDTHDHLNIP